MKKLIIIIVGIGIILISCFLIFKSTLSPLDELDNKNIERILIFNTVDSIYISARTWGLAGNHEEIVFSETSISPNEKEKQYIFYTDEVFYKSDNSSLVIYAPKSGIKESIIPFKNIEVKIKGLKTADEIRDYSINYEKYGLSKISIFED